MVKLIEKTIRNILPDIRQREYDVALQFLQNNKKILDVGCGTGTFMERCKFETVGIDINNDNVEYCKSIGLNAEHGDALNLQFDNDSFDGVHCSHVMQVFSSSQAVQMIKEFGRVVRPGGVIVITTLNDFTHFFQHPENSRPYPPTAIRALFGIRKGSTSPMYPDLPKLEVAGVWLRRVPLIKFRSEVSYTRARIGSVLNQLQYACFLRRPFTFDAYVMKLVRKE